MGIVPRPFEKAPVSLIQISNEKNIFIFDFEKLGENDKFLTFLIELFSMKESLKVMKFLTFYLFF